MAALQQLAASAGSNATDLYTNGTVAYFVDWAAPLPVLSPTTKVASKLINPNHRSWLMRLCAMAPHLHSLPPFAMPGLLHPPCIACLLAHT